MRLKIEIVGTQGKRIETVEVAPSGATVKEALEAAGIDTKNKDFTINGKIAKLESHIGPADVLTAQERAAPVVSVSARPQGS